MKVADLSVEELKELIAKTMEEKFREMIDPDYGLELRDDFIKSLERSMVSEKRIPYEEVKKKLGLK